MELVVTTVDAGPVNHIPLDVGSRRQGLDLFQSQIVVDGLLGLFTRVGGEGRQHREESVHRKCQLHQIVLIQKILGGFESVDLGVGGGGSFEQGRGVVGGRQFDVGVAVAGRFVEGVVKSGVDVTDGRVQADGEDVAGRQDVEQAVTEVERRVLEVGTERAVGVDVHFQVVLNLAEGHRVEMRRSLDGDREVHCVLPTLELVTSELGAVRTQHEKRHLPVGEEIVGEVVVGALIGAIWLDRSQGADAVEIDEEVLPVLSTDRVAAADECEETLLNLLVSLDVATADSRLRVGSGQTDDIDRRSRCDGVGGAVVLGPDVLGRYRQESGALTGR